MASSHYKHAEVPELQMLLADLSPGDARSAALDLTQFAPVRIRSADHPLFEPVYQFLFNEFGHRGEIEEKRVLLERLQWRPEAPAKGLSMLYELIAVQRGEELVAARDHTAIVRKDDPDGGAIVHLSHVLVDPNWRRTGLSGWLRAWPIQTAREALRRAGFDERRPITLVGEMEPPDASHPDRMPRLQAYERAGFLKIDPSAVPYLQPDFRPPAEIDRGGEARPLAMVLMVRRVGRESETHITGAELRRIVDALYGMYGSSFRPQDMAVVHGNRKNFPPDDARIALLKPTR
jgi:GNAT superfamily N-acetyltransferase